MRQAEEELMRLSLVLAVYQSARLGRPVALVG